VQKYISIILPFVSAAILYIFMVIILWQRVVKKKATAHTYSLIFSVGMALSSVAMLVVAVVAFDMDVNTKIVMLIAWVGLGDLVIGYPIVVRADFWTLQ
jgi:hypothetical protein